MEGIFQQIIVILAQALKLLVLVALLVGTKFAISYFKAKIDAIESKMSAHDKEMLDSVAKDTYLIIEQLAKNGDVKDKVDAFNKELKDKVPELTADEIDKLRELACGFFNVNSPKK